MTPRILAQEHGPGWQAALTGCQKLAPTALPYTATQVSALRSRLRKLAACMRAHGITHFPSPAAGPYGSAASPSRLYQQSLTYSRCMRSHGVPDFPILKQGPGGSLAHPVSPPAGMLSAPGYDAAFRSCLRSEEHTSELQSRRELVC